MCLDGWGVVVTHQNVRLKDTLGGGGGVMRVHLSSAQHSL